MDMSNSLERGMTLNNRTSPILIIINYYYHRKTKIQIFWFLGLYVISVDLFLIPLNLLPTEVLLSQVRYCHSSLNELIEPRNCGKLISSPLTSTKDWTQGHSYHWVTSSAPFWFLFWDRILLNYPCWPRTCNFPASVSGIVRIISKHHFAWWKLIFKLWPKLFYENVDTQINCVCMYLHPLTKQMNLSYKLIDINSTTFICPNFSSCFKLNCETHTQRKTSKSKHSRVTYIRHF